MDQKKSKKNSKKESFIEICPNMSELKREYKKVSSKTLNPSEEGEFVKLLKFCKNEDESKKNEDECEKNEEKIEDKIDS